MTMSSKTLHLVPTPVLPGATAREVEPPVSIRRSDQDFLYHLYRGSELLQANAVDEAKVELERALGLQPRDMEGQALLGVVYFRLGLYPRAIAIFQMLSRSNPDEVTPKVNLALCYLKTGQADAARESLEEVVEKKPTHGRAWGYLGLVYERARDFDKARIAFKRAGRDKLAARMAERAFNQEHGDSVDTPVPQSILRPSLMPGSHRPPPSRRVARQDPATIPPPSPSPLPQRSQVARPITAVSTLAKKEELRFPPRPGLELHPEGFLLATLDPSLAVRPHWVSSMTHEGPPFTQQALNRRWADQGSREPLGGAAPIVRVVGKGRLIVSPRPDTRLFLVTVSEETLYLRERHLICFEPEVEYDSGRLDPQGRDRSMVVKLSGVGTVAGFSRGRVRSLPVELESPLQVRPDRLIGWVGRLLPCAIAPAEAASGLASMVGFSGQGHVLVDVG